MDPTPLAERLRERARREGPLSFAAVMDAALHDPERGYYARGAERLGTGGDFYTAADLGDGLGRCLARQVAEWDGIVGEPDPFDVVEFGAGRGTTARHVLDALPEGLRERVRCTLVDRSAGMRAAAASTVGEATVVAPDAVPSGLAGAWYAVELFDALPVHRVVRRGGTLFELRVDEHLRFVEVEAAGPLAERARRLGAAPEDGHHAEICTAMDDAFDAIDRAFASGLGIVVDYGDTSTGLYRGRPQGTVQAYRAHRTSNDLLAHLGEQDLTAHVDFTALGEHAGRRGWTTLGWTTQERFLVGLGILDRFEATTLEESRDPERILERRRLMRLIHPEGMGRAFRVLVLAKGHVPDRTLAGLGLLS